MPPCHKVLVEKIKRANYVAMVWKNAQRPLPVTVSPVNNGWALDKGSYIINWYDGDQLPQNLSQLLGNNLDDPDLENDIQEVSEHDESDSEDINEIFDMGSV